MHTKKPYLVLNIVLIVLTLAFIWSRSFKSIPDSRAESEAIMNWLLPFLEHFVGVGNVTNHMVRKLAHFCEFGLLGVEMTALLWQLEWAQVSYVILSLLIGISCGGIDESIQIFTGRGNQLSDVLLDSCGFTTGVLGMLLVRLVVLNFKSKASTNR